MSLYNSILLEMLLLSQECLRQSELSVTILMSMPSQKGLNLQLICHKYSSFPLIKRNLLSRSILDKVWQVRYYFIQRNMLTINLSSQWMFQKSDFREKISKIKIVNNKKFKKNKFSKMNQKIRFKIKKLQKTFRYNQVKKLMKNYEKGLVIIVLN